MIKSIVIPTHLKSIIKRYRLNTRENRYQKAKIKSLTRCFKAHIVNLTIFSLSPQSKYIIIYKIYCNKRNKNYLFQSGLCSTNFDLERVKEWIEHKMIKRKLKLLQHATRFLTCVWHFVDTRPCGVKKSTCPFHIEWYNTGFNEPIRIYHMVSMEASPYLHLHLWLMLFSLFFCPIASSLNEHFL